MTPRTVRCPQCGAPARYAPDNPWRPFCSQRCRQIDLGAWAAECYRVPEPSAPAPDAGADEPSCNA
nr:DNA gyrase inhibitor YacG [Tepidimonas charontis]